MPSGRGAKLQNIPSYSNVKKLEDLGLEGCHRLSTVAKQLNVAEPMSDNAIDNTVILIVPFNVILTLYVISNRRGSALRFFEGLNGVRKSTQLSRKEHLDRRNPLLFPVLLASLWGEL